MMQNAFRASKAIALLISDACDHLTVSRTANFFKVSTQRKNYNAKQVKGVKQRYSSGLTDERQSLLQSIGFVWDHWEFEYQQQCVEGRVEATLALANGGVEDE